MKRLLILCVFVAVGCGQKKKDPLAGYEFRKNSVAPHNTPLIDQNVDACDYSIVTSPTMVVTEGNSVKQGVEIQGAGNMRVKNLSLSDTSLGVSLVKISKNKYAISYSASKNTIEPSKDYVAFVVELIPELSYESSIVCTEKIGVVVTRSDSHPVITKIEGPKSVSFDDTTDHSIQIYVQAKNLNSIQDLTLKVSPDKSTTSKENPVLDLSQAISMYNASVERVSEGLYKFTVSLMPDVIKYLHPELFTKELPNKTEAEFLTQFSVENSDGKLSSPSYNLVVKVSSPSGGTP